MTTRTSPWPVGVPCWTDLTTPDVDAAKRFYGDVLGWTFADTEEEYGGYTIAQVRGQAVAGVGPQQPGTPTAWTLYFASDDAEKTAAAVTENRGTVVLDVGDVGPLGRMFIGADPTRAAFGVWEAGTHIGAGIVNEPGAMTWEDLRTSDPETARAFYSKLFGYEAVPIEGAPPDYQLFALPDDKDAPLGGIGGMMGAEGAPPHWLVYFGVADTGAAVATAEQAGGKALMPPFDTPYGRMAGMTDPAGALFWTVQASWEELPDRSG